MHWSLDGWNIDRQARTATRANRVETLSPRAMRLLDMLADANGATISRADLLDRVWPNVYVSDESLTQVVAELRRTLENKDLIATVSKGGYRLTVPIMARDGSDADPRIHLTQSFSLDAYTLCIEAIECFSRAREGAERTSVDLAAQAAEIAPNYADARALHAAFLLKRHMIWSEGEMLMEKALDEVEAALALDPDHALAHLIGASIGMLSGLSGYGLPNLERSLALAPNDAALHSDASILLLTQGRKKGSAVLAFKSSRLDTGRFGDEMNAARLLMRSDPAWARACAERSLRRVREELSVVPDSMPALYSLGPLLAQLGETNAARAALEGVAHHDSPLEFFRAIGFALIGDVSSALDRLDFIAMRGWRMGSALDHEECFRGMMDDRRFQKLRGQLLAA